MSLWGDACRWCQQARWLIIAILTLLFVAWGMWGWSEVMRWYDDNAPAVIFGQGEASETAAYPSQVIIVYQPVTKLRDCEGVIQRIVTGQCGHVVVHEQPSSLVAGFSGRITIPVQVPYEAIPGQCGFQVHARYYCNPFDWLLQRQTFVSPLVPFTVREWGQ